MTKAKAIKHLGYARESLVFWQEAYVNACRDKNRMMDIKGLYLAEGFETLREMKKAEAVAEMNDAKARIAKFERIAK